MYILCFKWVSISMKPIFCLIHPILLFSRVFYIIFMINHLQDSVPFSDSVCSQKIVQSNSS